MNVQPKTDMVEAMDHVNESRVIDWIRECEAPVVNLMDDNIKISGPPLKDFTDHRVCDYRFDAGGRSLGLKRP